jgi:hypothetical protein
MSEIINEPVVPTPTGPALNEPAPTPAGPALNEPAPTPAGHILNG